MPNPIVMRRLRTIDNTLVIYTAADNTSTFDPSWAFAAGGGPMTVDWGDGTPKENHATGLSHTYLDGSIKAARFTCPNWRKVTTFNINTDVCRKTLPSFAACTALTDWRGYGNQFSGILPSFAACTALTTWRGYGNQFSGTLPSFAACAALTSWYGYSNQFSDILPSFAACTALTDWRGNTNQFSGILPSFAACTALTQWYGHVNQFSGTLPSFAACTALVTWQGYSNQFSGTLPSFAACTALTDWYGYINQFSGYEAGGFATQKFLANLNLITNNLPVASIDAILADLVTSLGISGRVACTVNLSGTGNAAPSDPAGLASKATLVAAGWTVTTN